MYQQLMRNSSGYAGEKRRKGGQELHIVEL